MQEDEALPSDLIIEPLKLSHLSMLRAIMINDVKCSMFIASS